VRDPDPTSRVGYTRIIGYSPSAGFVLTVITDPGELVRCDRVEDARVRPPRIPRRQGGRARHKAILAEVAQEEAETAEPKSARRPAPWTCHCTCASTGNWTRSCAGGPPPSMCPPPRWSGVRSGRPYTSTAPADSPWPRSRTLPAASPGKNFTTADPAEVGFGDDGSDVLLISSLVSGLGGAIVQYLGHG